MSTETVDPRFTDLDQWPTATALHAMVEGQLAAIAAIGSQVDAIAAAADAAADRLRDDGRLIYAGAGTSGRVAVQDGVELYPTFNWPRERLVYLMAGGPTALTHSVEGAEDDAEAGRQALLDVQVAPSDVVIGVAASGRTPFTIAVVEAARAAGALTVAIANNPDAPLLTAAEYPILLDTGSEVLAGSTRMKAGTAQKATLNMLSTAIMLRLGLVHRGRMVNMRVANDKLHRRAVRMVAELAAVDSDVAALALEQGGRNIRRAVLIARGSDPESAATMLHDAAGNLRRAITSGE